MLWFDKKARIRAMNTCDIFHFIAEYRPAEIFSGRQKKKRNMYECSAVDNSYGSRLHKKKL